MGRFLSPLLAGVLLLLLSASPLSAAYQSTASRTYSDEGTTFVATNGNDQTGDGSLANPYQTISHALTQVGAGAVITLRGGTYNEAFRVRQANITIRSKSDEWAVIQAPTDDDSIAMPVWLYVGSSGATLQRLEIIGGYYYGVKLETRFNWGTPDTSGVSNVTIVDCKIHDTGRDAIKITPNCDNITIVNNEIYNSGVRDNSNAEGIDAVNGDNIVVRDNYIHHTGTTGVYLKGGSTNGIIERNYIHDCGSLGISIGFDTSPEWFDLTANPLRYENINSVARNNIIKNTTYGGIGIYAAKDAKVLNNTLVDTALAGQNPIHFGLTYQDWVVDDNPDDGIGYRPPSTNVEVKNNIIVQQRSEASRECVGIRYTDENSLEPMPSISGMPLMEHNIYFVENGSCTFRDRRPDSAFQGNLAGWQGHISAEAASSELDPLLDSMGLLQDGSPAIGQAELSSWVVDDYQGQVRGATADIGADQFAPGSPVVLPPTIIRMYGASRPE